MKKIFYEKVSFDTSRVVINTELENFQNFDAEKILARSYFRHLQFSQNMTDKEILKLLPVGTVEESEKSVMKLRNILSTLESYSALLERKKEENQREFEKISAEFVNFQLSDGRRGTEKKSLEEKIQLLKQAENTIENFRNATNLLITEIKQKIIETDSAIGTNSRKILANRLKIARKELQMTQTELAEKIGMTQGGYKCYEQALREPPFSKLLQMSRILKKPVDWLIGNV